jgi:5-methylcytosine-specific restriction endonuclease McrA
MSTPKSVEKHCQACGVRMERKRFSDGRLQDYGTFVKQRFCSRACASKAPRNNVRRQKQQIQKQCCYCGECFHGTQRYCSDRCRSYAANRQRFKYNCQQCGKEFSTVSRTATFCGSKCTQAARSLPTLQKQCELCGVAFSTKRASARFCGYSCSARGKGIRKPKRVRPSGRNSVRRAKQYGVAWERIRHRDIYERDGWICGICGGQVDSSLKYPDPKSASLDHIVPFVRGGSHLVSNVRCSHFGCNLAKGRALDEEKSGRDVAVSLFSNLRLTAPVLVFGREVTP